MKDFEVFKYEEFIDCTSVKDFVDRANAKLNKLSVSQSYIGQRVVNCRDYSGWIDPENCGNTFRDHIAKGGKAYEAMIIGIRDVEIERLVK